MATVTGLSAERMIAIEQSSVVDAKMVDGNLILTKKSGQAINVGPVSGFTDADLKAVAEKQFRKGLPALPKTNETLVVFTFDDSPLVDYTIVRPILNARKVPGVFAAISGNIGKSTSMTWDHLKTLEAEGHEIADHTTSHQHLNSADLHKEVVESKNRFRTNGIQVNGLVYPYGENDEYVRQIARENYEWAATTATPQGWVKPFRTYQMPRAGIGNTSVLATLKNRVNNAITNGELLTFIIHAGFDLDTAAQGVLGDLIDYIQSVNVPIVTMTEALRRVGNVIDIGDYPGGNNYTIVDGSGGLHSKGAQANVELATFNAYTADEPPSTYKVGVATYFGSNQGKAAGWPVDQAAIIMTVSPYNSGAGGWVHQTLYNHKQTWIRKGASETKWTSWTLVGGTTIESSNAERPYFDYNTGITVSMVQGPPAVGAPDSAGGLMITYKSTSPTATTYLAYDYQEFHTYGKDDYYRRRVSSSGEWQPWVKLLSEKDIYAFRSSGLDINSLVTDFKIGMTTIPVLTSKPGPMGLGGLLVTHRNDNSNHGYAHQIFYEFQGDRVFTRGGSSDGTWRDWKLLTTTTVA